MLAVLRLDGAEFWVGLEPCPPAGEQGLALALAGEDTMQVSAINPEGASGEGCAGMADAASSGLFRNGFHQDCLG